MTDAITKTNICIKYFPARYVLAILGSLAMAITYALKVNISIAMVGMLNHTAVMVQAQALNLVHSSSSICEEENVTNVAVEDGPFVWSESLQGMILSSYFWGYMAFQIPGGRIAEKFSAKWVMFVSVAVNIVCTLLTPLMAEMHYVAMVIMRIGEGLGGAVTFPAMHVLLAHWAPPAERGLLTSIVYAGTCLGTVASIFLAGFLAANWGWQSVFYVMGIICIPWCVLWTWLVQDTPSQQSFITEEERQYITKSLGNTDEKIKGKLRKFPWKSIITSVPFWAILIAHFCNNWGWYLILIELPFYMRQILKFNIKENAVLTAIPFLSMWLFSILLSKLLDWLKEKQFITVTSARKIATAIASVIPAIILIALGHIGCLRWVAVILMIIVVTAKGGMFCGFLSNHIDIASNFAGTLIAITNTIATIPGIVVPLLVGYLTNGNQTIEAWRIIFYVTVVLYLIEIIVYNLFGSADEQSWNKDVNNLQEEQPLNQTNTVYQSTAKD